MESPSFRKSWKQGMHSADIVYPNKYYGGVYCLGPLVLCNIIDSREKWVAERVFLDRGKITGKFVGFTLQYELDCYNVLEMMGKAGIPLKGEREQVVFAGGPLVNSNPRLMSEYFDFLVVGEAEEVFGKVLDAYEVAKGKQDFLRRIALLAGIFVPGLSKAVVPCFVRDLDAVSYPLIQPLPKKIGKEFVFGSCFMLEIERGCPFACKFCAMPVFYGKARYRSLGSIKRIIDGGLALNSRDRVVIYSASFSHPDRKEILGYLISKGVRFSVPSLKADLVDAELLELVRKGGQNSVTIAPECNERLRKMVSGKPPDARFFKFVDDANSAGISSIKFYFMVGLPGQELADLEEMVDFIRELKRRFRGRSYISVNPFVSKPGTEFENAGFDVVKVRAQVNFLRKALGREGVRFKIASVKNSYLEWKIANSSCFPIA